eukprot:5831105-Alexandrium_andersonii.AAC.1
MDTHEHVDVGQVLFAASGPADQGICWRGQHHGQPLHPDNHAGVRPRPLVVFGAATRQHYGDIQTSRPCSPR